MNKLLAGGLALALAATAALPAMAGDRLYRSEPYSLTASLDGKPFWVAQAHCAGIFGAASQEPELAGDADQLKAQALTFANDAITRLVQDRKLTKAQAVDVMTPQVLKAREDAQSVLANNDTDPRSEWNIVRSTCLDVADSYRSQASW